MTKTAYILRKIDIPNIELLDQLSIYQKRFYQI